MNDIPVNGARSDPNPPINHRMKINEYRAAMNVTDNDISLNSLGG